MRHLTRKPNRATVLVTSPKYTSSRCQDDLQPAGGSKSAKGGSKVRAGLLALSCNEC